MVSFSTNKIRAYCKDCRDVRIFEHKRFPTRWACKVCGFENDFGRR